jgi:glycosyltransferase involved in cell wall biosynthesis
MATISNMTVAPDVAEAPVFESGERPRVAFPFVGDTIGGSHVSASLLMCALRDRGFEPVAVTHEDSSLVGWLRQRNLEVAKTKLPYLYSRMGGIGALARLGLIAPTLAGYLRRNRFALVHANDGRMIASWMPAARLAGIAAVAHARTKWNRSRLAYLSFRLAHRIIAISEYVYDGLPRGLISRTSVVTNPFDALPTSRVEAREIVLRLSKAERDAPIVAFVGTLQPQKRPETFLRSAKEILRNRPDAQFLLIGRESKLGGEMRSLASQLEISECVTFAGFQPDVCSLLRGCDVLLAPAVDEGHGRALVEAMLCDVPVVASASGGHLEIVKHEETGFLVPPDDDKSLAEKAIEIISNPGMARAMALNARTWSQKQFSVAEHARAVAAVYRTLLGS